MYILGVNAYHGNASAVLVHSGRLLAAAEEERFNRMKNSAGFPYQAVGYCVEAAGIRPEEISHIAISRDPNAHLHKKIWFLLSTWPSIDLVRDRLSNRVRIGNVREEVATALDVPPSQITAQLHNVEHHKAHMASSFFVSPFDKAAVLSMDGFGDFVSTMWGVGEGNRIRVLDWVEYPHSLGQLYTAITQYLGFPKYGDEYKVMGLASYGEAVYRTEFDKILHLSEDISYRINLSYFVHHKTGSNMTWLSGTPVIGKAYSGTLVKSLGPQRNPDEALEKWHHDVASSLQDALERAVLSILRKLYRKTGLKTLCLAGGVALNCVVNGKIFEKTPFTEVYIQPAAHDGGTALGAAYYVWNQVLGNERVFEMRHAYWGPEYTDEVLLTAVNARHARLAKTLSVKMLKDEGERCRHAAQAISDGKVVGWFQGRMEWGPRALGNRSILVDPRRAEMKDILNSRVKHREPFRPFAPSILEESTGEYFEETYPSPYMLMAYKVRPEKCGVIPATTHVDGTGRLQTVTSESNPLYARLINEFYKLTGVPVLLNTSFNDNEPIVCTPEEAIDCLLRTKMDILVLGPYVLEARA
ncbi:MAG: carbamoyltransferase [Candidatus Brocadiales bacterium]